MTKDKITNKIIFNEETDSRILNLVRKFNDDNFYANDLYKFGENEDSLLKGIKDLLFANNEDK